MAHWEIVEGAPGQGKSLYTARKAKELLPRNKRFYERMMTQYESELESWERSRALRFTEEDLIAFEQQYPRPTEPKRRLIASNIKFSEEFESLWPGWIIYWSSLDELHELRDVDIIWDEIATELDARNWANLSPETMRMLSQYRKRGLDIYANTQDFSMVDVRARLMITSVKTLSKVIGSPDPSATKPKIEKIWGLVFVREVENWKQTQADKKVYSFTGWSFYLIEREDIEIYDTRQDIKHGGYPALRHVVRYCEDPECRLHEGGIVKHV